MQQQVPSCHIPRPRLPEERQRNTMQGTLVQQDGRSKSDWKSLLSASLWLPRCQLCPDLLAGQTVVALVCGGKNGMELARTLICCRPWLTLLLCHDPRFHNTPCVCLAGRSVADKQGVKRLPWVGAVLWLTQILCSVTQWGGHQIMCFIQGLSCLNRGDLCTGWCLKNPQTVSAVGMSSVPFVARCVTFFFLGLSLCNLWTH